MVLGLGKLKSGVKKMFRSSEDLSSESSKDVKKQPHTSDKGRRRSLVLESQLSPSSSSSSANLSTKLAALNLAGTSSSASFDDSGEDCRNLSVNGSFFRRKCLEESVEEEKENFATHPQFPSPSTSPSGLGNMQRYYRQPSMGIPAKELIQGIPRKRSRDLTEELKKARLRKSQSLSHLKYVNEEGDEIELNYEYELGTPISESHQSQHASPPVPKPRLSLLQKQNMEISEVERKRPLIIPRTSRGTVPSNLPANQPNGIGNREEEK